MGPPEVLLQGLLGLVGIRWDPLGPVGNHWGHGFVQGKICVFLDSVCHGALAPFGNATGPPRVLLRGLLGPVGAPGTRWDPWGTIGAPEARWDPLGPVGTRWDPLGPVGTRWDPLGPVGNVVLRVKTYTAAHFWDSGD